MSFNSEYLLSFLEDILRTPSPSGFAHLALAKVKKEAEKFGYKTELTPKGCLLINVPGQRANRTVSLSAHVDTLGQWLGQLRAMDISVSLRLGCSINSQ